MYGCGAGSMDVEPIFINSRPLQVVGVGISCFDSGRQNLSPEPVVDAPILASYPQALVFASKYG